MRAQYSHPIWAIDFQFNQTMDGHILKLLNVINEYSRFCLAIWVGRRCTAVEVIDTIEELLKLYQTPTNLCMANEAKFIGHALQEWFTVNGTATSFIPPDSPWGNPFVESINSRLKDVFLIIKLFSSLPEAKLLAEPN